MSDIKTAYPSVGAAGGSQQPRSATTLIAVAIGMGLLTALTSTIYISRISAQTRSQMVTVWRLRADAAPGNVFKADRDVRDDRAPKDMTSYMPDLITDPKVLGNYNDRPFTRGAKQNAYVTLDLFESGSVALDTEQLSPETVGAPLVINARTTPGILRPGMFVNILGTFTAEGRLPTTKLVMEKVKVVAVGTRTEESGGRGTSFGNVTVEVKPAVGLQLVTIARHIGRDGFDVLILHPNYPREHTWDVNPEVKKLAGIAE